LAQIDASSSAASDRRRASRPLHGLVGPTIAAAIAFLTLVSLGLWQVRRLAWKEALLAQIEMRLHAPTQPLPGEASWPALSPTDYEYRHVSLRGAFENDKEVAVFDAGGEPGRPDVGPGWLVLAPFRLDDGSRVIVNRGFVSNDHKDPATRPAGQIQGETTVVGVMRAPQSRNLFTPADDPAKGVWFTRDPLEIAAFERLARTAPFTVDADASAAAPRSAPAGGATALDIPNNHLSYAITWFGLAGTLVGVWGAFAWRRSRT
jgi:surfeit locus 1 family protein